MEGEKEERFSPEGLKCLREEVEGLRERLVSEALREKWAQKRRVTVGRTPLEGCLRQLERAQEKEAKEEEMIPEEAQEKGLALTNSTEFLREKQKGGKKARPPRKGTVGVVRVVAPQGGRGDKDQAGPLRRSEGLTGGPQEGEEQPQLPPLAPEEPHSGGEGREALEPQKGQTVAHQGSGGEGEAQDWEEDGSEEEDGSREEDDTEEEEEDGSREDDDTEEEDGSREDDGRDDDDGSEGTQGEDSEEEGSSQCRDEEEDSDGHDPDQRAKDIRARCDALRAKVNELEQEVDRRKDFTRVSDLMEKVEELERDFLIIQYDTGKTLVNMMFNLWVVLDKMMINLWDAALALQENISRFLPGMAAVKIESSSLYYLLLVIKTYSTTQQICYGQELDDWKHSLCTLLLNKKGSLESVVLKQVGSIKEEVDLHWSAVVVHMLLKQGQKKIDSLQEKLDAVPNLSLEQAETWKVEIAAVRKKMRTLRKFPLKEVFLLMKTVDGLADALEFGHFKETIALCKKAKDLIVSLKLGLQDVPQEEEVGPLWKQANALDAVLHDIPFKKLPPLDEKQKALRGKVETLQGNPWSSLQKRLHSPTDASVRLAEEMNVLQKNPCNPLQEKLGALQKVAAPIEEVEEAMEMDRSRFSEREKVPEAGVKEMCVSAGRITDQPASMVAKVAAPSSLEATNATRSVGCTGNLSDSVSNSTPSSNTGVRKTWHGEVTLEDRNSLISKFAQTIFLNNDSEAAKDKLVGYARQIEEDMFGQAESKSEYHALVVKKLHAIHEKLHPIFDASSPIQGDMGHGWSLLQVSSTQPPVIQPMSATTGEAQPSLRPRGSECSLESSRSVQLPQPPVASSKASPMNYQVQMSNTNSVSTGQVPDAALPGGSLNMPGAQNSHLSCSPVTQPSIPQTLPSTSTMVGLPPVQCQTPLGMTLLQPAAPAPPSTPFSSSGLCPTSVPVSVPDGLKEKGTALGRISHGSRSSNFNAISEARAGHTSASLTALSVASPGSTGSWPLARKTPPLRLEVSEDPSVAFQTSESIGLNSSKEQNPQEATCTEFSEDRLVGCDPTLTETGGSEPPHKKQKMGPVDGTQMTSINEELYAAVQKYITVTMHQNMEKIGELMSRLHGPTNQATDFKEAKVVTSDLQKILALLKCFFEDF